ncbi:MAG: hypothetical protein ACKOFF_07145 [Acidimicrobiales bacterium]
MDVVELVVVVAAAAVVSPRVGATVVVVVVATVAAVVFSGAAGADTTGVGTVAAGAAAARAVTVTDCDAAADEYVSLPVWLAEITHVPTALNVTTPADTEQTACDWFAMAMAGARKAVLSTETV